MTGRTPSRWLKTAKTCREKEYVINVVFDGISTLNIDPDNIWWTVQIMKLLIMQFSKALCYILFHRILLYFSYCSNEACSFHSLHYNRRNYTLF